MELGLNQYYYKNLTIKQLYQDDEILLRKIATGDLSAYRYLFDTYFTDLCNFLLLYLHNKSFAEEIALEIFTQIWEKRESLEIRNSLKGYLFTSAKNRAISFFRREKQHLFSQLGVEDELREIDSSSQNYLENKELKQLINQAISTLPDKSRMIYQLAWEENMSHKEIAQKLGISSKTVENHVGIALRKLRAALKPYYEQIFVFWLIFHKLL